jgi:hypothetical protein
MKHLHPFVIICLVLSAVFVSMLIGWTDLKIPVAAENRMLPDAAAQRAKDLTKVLKRAGYEVSFGYLKQYTMEDCDYSLAVMGSCFLNNPAAPYVIPVMPVWSEEWVDPATAGTWGPDEEGYSSTYRLDPGEAILIFGKLPSPARYFGLQSYHFTREGTYDSSSAMYLKMMQVDPAMPKRFFHTVPGNPARIIPFASLSNAINNVVIQQQSGAAFNQLRYFIITPDQLMDQGLRKVLHRAGIQQKDIFTEPIPSNMRTGLHEHADEFVTTFRYSEPEDHALADAWREDPSMIVMRIRPIKQNKLPVPYPEVQLEQRLALPESYLKNDLDRLVEAIFERWNQAYKPEQVKQQIDFQSVFEFVGPLCEKIGMDCLGDTQDAAYQARIQGLTLDFGEVYAYVGALGTETGNATYVGLGINNGRKMLGVGNISDHQLKGSANAYSGEVDNTGKLFVHYFARSCDGLEEYTSGYCTEITPEMIPICADPAQTSCIRVLFTERDYMFPGSRRGPDSAFLLPGRIIKLQDPRQ